MIALMVDRYIRDVPEDLWKSLRVIAARRHMSIGKIVIEAMERYLETEKK